MSATTAKRVPFRLLVVGDVMLGRLVDQLLPFPVNEPEERLHARHLILHRAPQLMPVIKEMGFKYPWGDTLPLFDRSKTHLRIANLETSITRSERKWPRKAFNYRMSPENAQALKEANIDYCSLANNHVLDFQVEGMVDTLRTLDKLGIARAGAGMNLAEAQKPAVLNVKLEGGGGVQEVNLRVGCFSFADHYDFWAATQARPGINFIDVNEHTATDRARVKAMMNAARQQYELEFVIVSLHCGHNYQWRPHAKLQQFVRFLIDECGADLIHGHSSHHVQGIEVYKGKPIIYGCGDFVDDYAVDDEYRNDLSFAYLPVMSIDAETKKAQLESLTLVPTKIELCAVSKTVPQKDRAWLFSTMQRCCDMFGTRVEDAKDGTFRLCWEPAAEPKETQLPMTGAVETASHLVCQEKMRQKGAQVCPDCESEICQCLMEEEEREEIKD